MADGNSPPSYTSSDPCRVPRDTKFAQRRAVGDGGWSDAVLLQEFSHQLERRLAVSPRLNQDVQDLAFGVVFNALAPLRRASKSAKFRLA
jgi:hypothetical protein